MEIMQQIAEHQRRGVAMVELATDAFCRNMEAARQCYLAAATREARAIDELRMRQGQLRG